MSLVDHRLCSRRLVGSFRLPIVDALFLTLKRTKSVMRVLGFSYAGVSGFAVSSPLGLFSFPDVSSLSRPGGLFSSGHLFSTVRWFIHNLSVAHVHWSRLFHPKPGSFGLRLVARPLTAPECGFFAGLGAYGGFSFAHLCRSRHA